jgi:hypothetical protein
MTKNEHKIPDDAFENLLKEMYGDTPLPDDLKQQIRMAMETGEVAPKESDIPPEDREPINTEALANDLSSALGKVKDRQKNLGGCCG